MAALNPSTTAPATANGDVESSMDGLLGDLGLELSDGLLKLEVSAAGAQGRQRDRNDLIHVSRRLPAYMDTVVLAWLSPTGLRMLLGRPLRERGGLALLGPDGLLKLPKDIGELTFELRVLSAEFLDFAIACVLGCAVSHKPRVSPEIQHRRGKNDSSRSRRKGLVARVSDSSYRGYSELEQMC
jgi:hypothetical protein